MRPGSVNPERIIMSMNNHKITKCGFCEYTVHVSCWESSPLNCNWIIYLVLDVVTELTKKKRKTKSLSCFSSGDLTIIHTMNLVTLESCLFSRCVFIGCATTVL